MSSNSGEEEPPHTNIFPLTCYQPPCKKLKPSPFRAHGLSSSPLWELSPLPDEMVLNCLARVSRSDHASLSLVSKAHHSLLRSPEFYNLRSLMGLTEKFIFLCVSIPSDPFVRWFAFHPKSLNHPNRLVSIRPHLYQPPESSSIVAHGYGFYVIGGMISGKRSSRVFFLDCRTHTWTNLPSMKLTRASAAAGVVDGKIYVFGGCEHLTSINWGEVFDTKAQTWDALPMRPDHWCPRLPLIFESVVMEEKIFRLKADGEIVLYIPSQGTWKTCVVKKDMPSFGMGWHVIDNLMYSCACGGLILWCEPEEMVWRQVMGLDALRDGMCGSKLVNYGREMNDDWVSSRRELPYEELWTKELDDWLPGHKLSSCGSNMLVFWDVLGLEKLEIFCAEISLERRNDEKNEMWGNVEWSEVVMTLDPPPSRPHQCKVLYFSSFNL